MHLLLADETNQRPGQDARFLVYGGLIVPLERLEALDRAIAEARAEAGYSAGEVLKFDTRQRPERIAIEAATAAKQRVVAACRELECKFIAYVALHDIIRTRPQDEQLLFGVNSVLKCFHDFLEAHRSVGVVLLDTPPVQAPNQYYRERFANGLQYEGRTVAMPRIKLFGSTCIGASHVASAIDIVLGSFRYCVNAPRNRAAAATMASNVIDLMWGEVAADRFAVLESGLVLRPMLENIRVAQYRQAYEELLAHLAQLRAEARNG